jgi:hypothetical protein
MILFSFQSVFMCLYGSEDRLIIFVSKIGQLIIVMETLCSLLDLRFSWR